MSLFQFEFAKDAMANLPEPEGEVITKTEKIFVPVKEHPEVKYLSFFLSAYLKNVLLPDNIMH